MAVSQTSESSAASGPLPEYGDKMCTCLGNIAAHMEHPVPVNRHHRTSQAQEIEPYTRKVNPNSINRSKLLFINEQDLNTRVKHITLLDIYKNKSMPHFFEKHYPTFFIFYSQVWFANIYIILTATAWISVLRPLLSGDILGSHSSNAAKTATNVLNLF